MSDENVRPQDVPEGAVTEENLVKEETPLPAAPVGSQPTKSSAAEEEEARRAKVREVEERQRQRKPDEGDDDEDDDN